MNPVLILGAGGLGRELYWWACEAGLTPMGFIDDRPDALAALRDYPPVVGSVASAPLSAPILCGIGQNPIRRRCVELLRERGARFASCIHPAARVYHATLGEGAILAPGAYIGADAVVGDFLFMQTGAVLGHDVRAGDFLRMDTTAFVGGYATLGSGVTLHTGAQVMPSKRVGDNAPLGAGSTLLSNLPANTTAFGSPALPLARG